jgi:tRNA-dihydrouridine synthase B
MRSMPTAPIISLAPFQGITDFRYRRVFFSVFPDYDKAYAPFIKAVAGPFSASHLRDLLEAPPENAAIVPQVICNEADALAGTAARVADLGYGEINVNMGCPFPMVANKKRGSGILPHPELIDRMLDGALPRCPIPVSVKLRLGRFSADEMHAVLRVLNRYPLAEIILHPRTGVQLYEGRADLGRFGEFLSLSRNPVAYNGDILTREDWAERAKMFPSVKHWSLGRGALRNPFLASEIRGTETTRGERLAAIARFHDEYYGIQVARLGRNKQLLDIMKSIWQYLAWSLPEPEAFLLKARRAKTAEKYRAAVDEGLGRSGSVQAFLSSPVPES